MTETYLCELRVHPRRRSVTCLPHMRIADKFMPAMDYPFGLADLRCRLGLCAGRA